MSTADKDGRMAQIVSDLMACVGMSMRESLIEAKAKFDREMPPVEDDCPTDDDQP